MEIKPIKSFQADHTVIVPAIYISRTDGDITTYDLRTRRPNCGDYMDHITMHSVEHMFATYIRNSDLAPDVIYFGPMGCQTGFYLLVRNADNNRVREVVEQVLHQIADHTGPMFGQSEIECGNYKNLSVDAAKIEAVRYLDTLSCDNHNFEYPQKEAQA